MFNIKIEVGATESYGYATQFHVEFGHSGSELGFVHKDSEHTSICIECADVLRVVAGVCVAFRGYGCFTIESLWTIGAYNLVAAVEGEVCANAGTVDSLIGIVEDAFVDFELEAGECANATGRMRGQRRAFDCFPTIAANVPRYIANGECGVCSAVRKFEAGNLNARNHAGVVELNKKRNVVVVGSTSGCKVVYYGYKIGECLIGNCVVIFVRAA